MHVRIAIADCCTDIQYFRDVLKELGAPQHEPTPVHCDNAGAVRNSRYPTNKRTKHRNLQFSIVRDHVNAGQASLHDQDTVDNPADMHTKAVGPTKIAKHRRAIGVHEPNPSIPIVAVATRNPRIRMFQALADLKHAVARLK